MARRNPSFFESMGRAPWPVGVVTGLAVLIAGLFLLPAVLGDSQNRFLAVIATITCRARRRIPVSSVSREAGKLVQ